LKPPLPIVLNNAAAILAHQDTAALAAELPFVRAVLIVTAKEYDQCAARRVREIGVLSGLLAKGAGLPGCPVPAPEPAGGLLDADLRITALDAWLDRLRAQVIDLQVWLEGQAGEEAAALRLETIRHLHQTASSNAATLSSSSR
jgi:hypothetical protein